jgi:uncharacterized OB-fold protein
MMATRPLPEPDEASRPFWTGGAVGELRIMQCRDCQGFTHPPRLICRHCLSENVAPTAVQGAGTVETFTVNHQAWYPGLDVPYVIARVSLDGVPDVLLTTNIVGCPAEEVDIGDRVQVAFEQHGDLFVPVFEKARS